MHISEIKELRSEVKLLPTAPNDALQSTIDSQVACFLASGGKIEAVPTGKSANIYKPKNRPEPIGKRRV